MVVHQLEEVLAVVSVGLLVGALERKYVHINKGEDDNEENYKNIVLKKGGYDHEDCVDTIGSQD